MGIPILCKYERSEKGFFIPSASVRVHSIEELAYLIIKNPYLVDTDCMNQELLQWMSEELRMTDTADELRYILRSRASCARFAEVLLEDSGYCSDETIAQVYRCLKELELKTPAQMSKFRADQLFSGGRYGEAILCYYNLITGDDSAKETPEFIGNLWHNIGTAYARLFIFPTAAICYERAYQYGKNPVSYQACVDAKRMAEAAHEKKEAFSVQTKEQARNFLDECEKQYERMITIQG
jgi:tetratricopeptide (TPR) repeat protein